MEKRSNVGFKMAVAKLGSDEAKKHKALYDEEPPLPEDRLGRLLAQEILGVQKRGYYKIRSGEVMLSLEDAAKLSDVSGIPWKYFAKWECE